MAPTPARRRPLKLFISLLGVAAVVVGSLVFAPGAAQASHYRANQLTWHKTTGTTVEFHATGSWRCTYFSDPCTLAPGDTFSPSAVDFGDGDTDSGDWTVTAVDTANDVVSAERHVNHTYPSNGPFTASINGCCRLSSPEHINNPDGDLNAETLVDLGSTSASPVSTISPIVDCPTSGNCAFTIPSYDPDGQGLRYRFATADEAAGSGSSFVQPGAPNAPHDASINPTTGLYQWDTTGADTNTTPGGDTYYSTQVIVENVVGTTVVSKTAVDFFIRLGTGSSNQQPTFTPPTPADGTTINSTVGTPIVFSTAATDPDAGDTVTLGISGKPAGATYSAPSGNPAGGSFSWTPGAGDVGTYLLTLTATDQHGLGAIPRSITINVRSGGSPGDPGDGAGSAQGQGTTHCRVPGSARGSRCWSFDFDVSDLGNGASGTATVRTPKCRFVSKAVTQGNVSGNVADFSATGKWCGRRGRRLVAHVVDGAPDQVKFRIYRKSRLLAQTDKAVQPPGYVTVTPAGSPATS